MQKLLWVFCFGVFCFASCSEGDKEPEVLGCTDSLAINYNKLANKDDGTCIFPADQLTGSWVGKDEVRFFNGSNFTMTALPTVNYTATVTKTDKKVITISGTQPTQIYLYKGPLTIDWNKMKISVTGTNITGTILSKNSFSLEYTYGISGGAYLVKQTFTR